jgi:hypothetical protein
LRLVFGKDILCSQVQHSSKEKALTAILRMLLRGSC